MSRIQTEPAPIPDLVLERYHAGELPAAAADGVRAALESDDALRARLEALAADDDRQRKAYPPATLAAAVLGRVRVGDSVRRRRYALLVPAAAAVLVAVVMRLPPSVTTGPDSTASAAAGDDVRIKGVDASLVVHRHTGAGSEPLADTAVARPGDLIRLGYRVSADVFGAIVSVDGRGVVTQHLPARGRDAAALHGGATVWLDEAFELDDAPREERFYLVSAPHPFDVTQVTDAIRGRPAGAIATPPALAPDFTFTTFSLRKESRP